MLDENQIMPYNFFDYGGVYSGEHQGMRYIIKRIGEKPDYSLQVQVWQGPFCSSAVSEEKKTTKTFAFTEEGRIEGIEWLKDQYETRKQEWAAAPSILEAELEDGQNKTKES